MARIAGVEIPREKAVEVALTSIYGIGRNTSRKIIQAAKIVGAKKVSALSEEDVNKLRQIVEGSYVVEGQLRQEVRSNIKRLIDIRSWRGSRHDKRLPTRGQQTRTNSRTIRGNVRRTASGTSSRRSQPTPT